jgi:voltage-gated potassium channel
MPYNKPQATEPLKKRIYQLLNNKSVESFIYGLIIINIVAIVLESYQKIGEGYYSLFHFLEVFSVIIFTVEYLLRLWVADMDESVKKSRLRFVLSPLGLIDLLAIIPFYLPMLFAVDLRVVRILRLLRILRIFKLGRYSKSLKTILQVYRETKTDLAITLFFVFVLLVLSSTLMYHIENEAQPGKFASIGHAFWWSIATLTTVGYGDVFPVTVAGKFLSAIIALIGIGFIALPTGIISSSFMDKIQKNKQKDIVVECTCPKCNTTFLTRTKETVSD